MANERTGIVTFKGGPVTLVGNEVKEGDKAPDFKLVDNGLQEVTLKDSAGKTRIICSLPSVDTPVCAAESKKFNDLASGVDNVEVLIVSKDLPFAQKRFCAAENADNINTLSDYRGSGFAEDYGVFIKELSLLARAVFVVGPDDTVKHVQIVGEIAEEPDYDKVMAAAK